MIGRSDDGCMGGRSVNAGRVPSFSLTLTLSFWFSPSLVLILSLFLSRSVSLSLLCRDGQWLWRLLLCDQRQQHHRPLLTCWHWSVHLECSASWRPGSMLADVHLVPLCLSATVALLMRSSVLHSLPTAVDVSMATTHQPSLVPSGFNYRVQRPRGPRDPPAGWSRPERWGPTHWLSWTGKPSVCVCERLCVFVAQVAKGCHAKYLAWCCSRCFGVCFFCIVLILKIYLL